MEKGHNQPGKAIPTVRHTGYAATATPVDPIAWDASMDAELRIQYGDYTLDCQTIAEKLGKHHATAMAGQKQKWLRTTCYRFDIQMICGRIETKHKDIEDAAERKETIKQEYQDFLEGYECIVFGH
jgi:hypothetical protein